MLTWFRGFSLIAKVAAGVVAITGAIVGVAAAWPLVESVFPAHRGLVYEQIGEVKTPLKELLIWKFTDTKNRARSEAADWSIKLPKEQDPQTRAMIQRRVEQLNQEQEELDARIKKLTGR